MGAIFQWCNDNQGVLAAVAILIVVVPSIFGIIPKCSKRIRQIKEKNDDDAHNADLKVIVEYLKDNIVVSTKKLEKVLNKSEEEIQKLLSELIDRGIVVAACDNCKLSDPNSAWELSK